MEPGKGGGRSQSNAAVKRELENSRNEFEQAAKILTSLVEHANTIGSLGPEGPAAFTEIFAVTIPALKGYVAPLRNVFLR